MRENETFMTLNVNWYYVEKY